MFKIKEKTGWGGILGFAPCFGSKRRNFVFRVGLGLFSPPDQIRAVESRGGTGGRGVGGRGWGKVRPAKWKRGRGKCARVKVMRVER